MRGGGSLQETSGLVTENRRRIIQSSAASTNEGSRSEERIDAESSVEHLEQSFIDGLFGFGQPTQAAKAFVQSAVESKQF